MAGLVARMRELAQGDPPTPEAMVAFARRIMNELDKASPEGETKETPAAPTDEPAGETGGKADVDPLRKRADALAVDVASAGVSRKPPTPEPAPEPVEVPSAAELRDKANELMLELLTGDIPT